ncbi:hypothetical protein EVAR_35332_1 [Eumeta japonica]|uniref:Uncharacterized protein n=1 Tax=Eumeta variegata TaxID=151549 RepID=A0A4C1XKB9_EUMVA|nr:hypothetical protein EVAR_35332_1 [Eumeta japonica]
MPAALGIRLPQKQVSPGNTKNKRNKSGTARVGSAGAARPRKRFHNEGSPSVLYTNCLAAGRQGAGGAVHCSARL